MAGAGADAQQAIGRLRCRRIRNGKALPVRIFITHLDDKERNFKQRLMRAYPKATWKDQASENRLKRSMAYRVSWAIEEYVKANYQPGKPLKAQEIRENVPRLLDSYRPRTVSDQVWRDAKALFLKRNKETWVWRGHSLALLFDALFPDQAA